jgi:PAS domain S-box-containing protein
MKAHAVRARGYGAVKQVSLRLRMLAIILLITVTAIIIVGVTSYTEARKSILGSLHDNAAAKVRSRAENMSEWIQSRLALVEVMSRTDKVRFGTEEERLAYFRLEAQRSGGVFYSIGFAELNGRLLRSNGETLNIAEEPTFKKVLQGHYEVSDPFIDKHANTMIFTLQVPVYGAKEEIIGLVNAAILMNTAVDSIVLFNHAGQAIFPEQITPALQGISAVLLRQDHGSIQIDNNGSKEMLFYASVPTASWLIGTSVPLKDFDGPLQALLSKTIFAIAIAIALMAGLLFVLLNREIHRIRQLVTVTETVAAGNFDVPSILFKSRDELSALAESINTMIVRLRDMFQRLEVMINQNGFAMMSLDQHYVVNYFSKAAEELLGYTSEEVIGKATPLWFIHQDELNRVAADLSIKLGREVAPDLSLFAELRNLSNNYEMEWIFVRKDGKRFPVLHNSNGVRDLNGEVTGIVVITRDITEQKQAQADLMLAKHEAEEANQAKGEFVARISHEIRTPLSGIIGLAQLMQKTAMNDIQKDYLDKMLSSSYAMLAIINEILDFSKVEAGKLELESISFSPEWLLSKAADMIGVFLIEKDQLDFIVEVEESLPNTLIGDPTRLEQILLNLCFNAIKFTEKGHVILKVEGLSTYGNAVEVRFSVEDTGIGMTAMQIERLFTPYAQGDDSTSRKYGGTGLGLFISKSLVEMMGGLLEVESEPGKGSCFYFTLRLQAGIVNKKEENMLLQTEFRHHPVWLVEDGPRMRTHLCRTIAGFGLQVVEFAAWKDALESLLEGNAPEGTVLLLDMEAADMFGHETFYELRQAAAERGVYTLAVTSAYGREEMNRMPPSLKPDGILVKPIHRVDLHQALLSLFAGKQSEPASTKNKSPDPAQPVKGRILLADDYEINRQVAITLLESHGYEVKVALNGLEVLIMLEEPGWDLVLMDIQMPKMDGRETTRRIRQDPRFGQLPIIAMTAYATPEELASFIELGMNDTLIKPIEEGPLLAAIDQLLAKSRSRKHDAAKKQPEGQEEIPFFLENLAGIQAKDALTRINGKVPIFMHMLQTFKRDFSDHEKKIRQAYEQDDQQELMHLLHSLRGAAGTISARDLYMAAGRLEDFFEADLADEAEWSRLLDEVSSALREIIGSLEQLDD